MTMLEQKIRDVLQLHAPCLQCGVRPFVIALGGGTLSFWNV